MNEIIKRYNICMSIINNNQGVRAMLNKIKWIIAKSLNKISNIIDSMFEKVGYHFVGYKVDIELLMTTMRYIKSNVIKNGDNIRALEKDISDTREYLNNLKSSLNKRLLKLEDFELRTLKEKAEKVLNLENEFDEKENAFRLANKLIDTPFKDDDNLDNCANDVIKLVNKYHYLVDDNGVGSDNEYFIDDVKRIITKHINLNNERGENAK